MRMFHLVEPVQGISYKNPQAPGMALGRPAEAIVAAEQDVRRGFFGSRHVNGIETQRFS
jgi:hypothetical protein